MASAACSIASHSAVSSGSVTSPHLRSGHSGDEGEILDGKSTADKIRILSAQERLVVLFLLMAVVSEFSFG